MPKGPVKTLFYDYAADAISGKSDHKGPKHPQSDLSSPELVIGIEIADEPTALFPIESNLR